MNEPQEVPTESGNAGAWLTLAEVSVRVGVSERTLRKRIAAGSLAAEKQPLEGGGVAWRVPASAIGEAEGSSQRGGSGTEGGAEANGREAEGLTLEAATEAEASHIAAEGGAEGLPQRGGSEAEVSGHRGGSAAEGTAPPFAMMLIEAQAAEIAFLKGTIEAERRESALTIAALREAIKAMPKALTAGEESKSDSGGGPELQQPATPSSGQLEQVGTGLQGPQGAQDAQGGAQTGPATATTPEVQNVVETQPAAATGDATAAKTWYPPKEQESVWRRFKVWLVGG